jgi:hypothetical protein
MESLALRCLHSGSDGVEVRRRTFLASRPAYYIPHPLQSQNIMNTGNTSLLPLRTEIHFKFQILLTGHNLHCCISGSSCSLLTTVNAKS